jgi:tubulin-folding cofactor B
MSLQAAADVPLIVNSANSSSERRISPSWTIAHLKTRLEPITGVPASCQQLTLRVGSQDAVPLAATDEEQAQLAAFPLQPYAEITVSSPAFLSLRNTAALDFYASLPLSSPMLPHLAA